MRHIVITLLVATICLTAAATSSRSDYSFSTEVFYACDDDDPSDCRADHIILSIKDTTGKIVTREVWAQPLDTALWHGFGDIREDDINFDGYPDLLVCNGPTNGFGNFTYSAWVWDPTASDFIEVPGFDELFDFELDEEDKQVASVWRLDNDMTITTYEWRDGVLTKIKSRDYKYEYNVEY